MVYDLPTPKPHSNVTKHDLSQSNPSVSPFIIDTHSVNRADPAAVTGGTCDPSSFVLVNHIAYSGLHVGHSLNDENEVTQACDLWKGTKIEKHITLTHSLRHAQWNKLAWNIPFNGLTIALGTHFRLSSLTHAHAHASTFTTGETTTVMDIRKNDPLTPTPTPTCALT